MHTIAIGRGRVPIRLVVCTGAHCDDIYRWWGKV